MKKQLLGSLLYCCIGLSPVSANETLDALFKEYRQAGAGEMSVERGKKLWFQEQISSKGDKRSCVSCHQADLTQMGKHADTGKTIEPLAPSVNAKRLTSIAEIQKWLRRNCQWTFERECTAQEKMDVLGFIQTQ